MTGLGAEVAKNLVLSGINSLTIIDENLVNERDLKLNFLIQKTSLNKNVTYLIKILVSKILSLIDLKICMKQKLREDFRA